MTNVKKPAFWIPVFLTILLLGGAVRLQDELIYRRRLEPSRFRDSLYLPDSRYVQFISLGYDNFAADFLWLRMIQSFAAGWSRPENKAQMKSYFDVITDLDRHYLDVYNFAIMALGEEQNEHGEFDKLVLETVDKAIEYNPRSSFIPHQGAFYAWWRMKNVDLAKYYIQVAMNDPDHPEFIERWPMYLDLKSGRFRTAYEKYFTDCARIQNGSDDVQKGILLRSFKRAVSQWIMDAIKNQAIEWKKTHGAYPTIDQLNQSGGFKDIELPNWPYIQNALDQALDQKINLADDPKKMAQAIADGLKKWDQVPPSPFDDLVPKGRSLEGYVIWPGLESTEESFVLTKIEAIHKMQDVLRRIEADGSIYKKTHDGEWPQMLHDFTLEGATYPKFDAFGGTWTWDPKTGLADCTGIKNIKQLDLPEVS